MKPVILFAPGAGQPSSSAWMQAWAAQLTRLGTVVPFDHPYHAEGRRRPDRMPVLVAHAHERLVQARTAYPAAPIVFAGKSMGSRVGCHLSVEAPIDAIVCFGYPLAGGGDPSKLRDEVLRAVQVPVLFLQGTRDRLAPLDLLESVRTQMTAPTALHVVPTGDHSLLITKTHTKQTGRTQTDEDEATMARIETFLGERLRSSPGLPMG